MTTDEGQAAFAYYAWGNGGGFVDDEGNWTINSPENVEAVEFAVNLYKKGYTNPNPATQTRYDLQDMFGAGKLAMVIAPNSLPTYIATKGYTDVNYAVADIPHNEGKTSSSVGVMDRIMAFKDDSAPDQAARNEAIGKFLTFFYDPENYVGWVSMEDFLPAVNSAVAALVEANPSFEAWLKVLHGSHTVKIVATDAKDASVTRTLTFTKAVTSVEFEQTLAMEADAMPTKALVNIQGNFPAGCTLQVWICNNGNDASPTWEDITQKVRTGQKHYFTNKTKTAAAWGVKVKAKLLRGSATETCYIQSIGGNFA